MHLEHLWTDVAARAAYAPIDQSLPSKQRNAATKNKKAARALLDSLFPEDE